MRYDDDESLTGLDTAQRGSRPRQRWTGSLPQRGRAAQGLPQAVFKISSYSHSAGAVWARVEYVTREGELEAEDPNGVRLELDELEAVVEEWERETPAAKGRRFAMSAVVSFPVGVDEEKATEAARQFFGEAFAANHDYVFAGHRDTEHYHVHVVVQARGHDGEQLRIGREDLQDLRLLFAEKAHEQGIELDASPRWARGLEQDRQPSQAVEGIMRRWRDPELELAGAVMLPPTRRTQLEALVDVRRERETEGREVSPLEYARAAELVAGQIGQGENEKEKAETMKAAIQLARFGLQRSADPSSPAEERALVGQVAGEVDKAIGSHMGELAADKAAMREALSARRPLAARLAEDRPTPERRWAREAAVEREAGPEAACQALEYARSAAGMAAWVSAATNDKDRLSGVKASVSLARFGWDLTHKDQGTAAEREEARGIINRAERALRSAINRIEDPQAQRQAIQARQTLYTSELKEYREQSREREWERRAAAEARDTGPELEP